MSGERNRSAESGNEIKALLKNLWVGNEIECRKSGEFVRELVIVAVNIGRMFW